VYVVCRIQFFKEKTVFPLANKTSNKMFDGWQCYCVRYWIQASLNNFLRCNCVRVCVCVCVYVYACTGLYYILGCVHI